MVAVDVVSEERYWYPDDGGAVWVAGFQPVAEDGRYLPRDAPELAARGLLVTWVAGVAHGDGLQDDAAAPGSPLRLARDPGNQHDPNAIAVELAAGPPGRRAGWVPREHAARLAPELDAGRPWAAVVLRERRASPREPRTGLTMLLAAAPAIELRERPRRPPA